MTCRSAAIAASYGDRRGAVGCETQALRRQPTDPRLKTIATYTSGTLTGDVLAGISVAIVIIPQSLAYAQIAGLPPHIGLFAAALPLVVASFFVSSPYLQTGPVALTSLLHLGALKSLEPEGTAEYIQLAAMLAIVVGGTRLLLGLARMGGIAYLMSEPVVLGFTSGAAILIVSSQVPNDIRRLAPRRHNPWHGSLDPGSPNSMECHRGRVRGRDGGPHHRRPQDQRPLPERVDSRHRCDGLQGAHRLQRHACRRTSQWVHQAEPEPAMGASRLPDRLWDHHRDRGIRRARRRSHAHLQPSTGSRGAQTASSSAQASPTSFPASAAATQ